MGQFWAGTEFGSIQPSQEYQDHTLLENNCFEDPEKFDSWAGCEMVGQVKGGGAGGAGEQVEQDQEED